MFDKVTNRALRWSAGATVIHVIIWYNIMFAKNPFWSTNPWW